MASSPTPALKDKEIPKREPSWAYIRHLERRQHELHSQIILWAGIAVFSALALLAISTLAGITAGL
ncbi:MAG: hypothetical protein IBX61_09430 [Thermoleophilia bacterium]|nr:hypothetical protein [Thermoleophilia bacterium]